MIKTILLLLIISQTSFSENLCKETIIEFYNMVGFDIKAEDFSSMIDFSEVELTTEEFNELDTSDQKKYFDKLMPLTMKAKKTLSFINYLIEDVRETALRIYLYSDIIPYTEADLLIMMKRIEMLESFEKRIEVCTH